MSDMICRKSMMRCQTPGMCSPHGGCRDEVTTAKDRQISALIAENERLATEMLCPACKGSGDGWVMSGSGPDDHHIQADCPECSGRGALVGAYESMKVQRDALGERCIAAGGDLLFMRAERDQLKAVNFDLNIGRQAADEEIVRLKSENAGLKTGYEAYEQVVQGLKAEISRLRAKHGDFTTGPGADDAPYLFSHSLDRKGCTVDFNGTPYHYAEMSEGFVACACGDEYRDDSYGAGFMAANGGVCESCDAAERKDDLKAGLMALAAYIGPICTAAVITAMSKGEQS